MLVRFLVFCLIFLIAQSAICQHVTEAPATEYFISFPNAVHHEAEVKVIFRNANSEELNIRMARSSPGRYALHEFAKNIYNVRVTDLEDKAINFTRANPHQWTVRASGPVVFSYTLFGDRADGTYNQIDLTHAHLNIPASLAYALELTENPSQIQFSIPEGSGWKTATQLKPSHIINTFTAPNLAYLMDSPVKLAAFSEREWKVTSGGKEQTIAFALHHTTSEKEVQQFETALKKIVNEAAAIFGGLPEFDFGRYTFIACYMPHANGDGMEHRNSTILTSSKSLKTDFNDLLGTAAHEFFHAWNVERIRPKSLEPFRFDEANMSSELWLAEGFTTYYGELLLRRAGLYSDAEFMGSLEWDLNAYLESPGAKKYSPAHMSRQAPFVDAARAVDPVSWHNTYLSYYTYGSVLAAYLDLTLRSQFPNLSLDNYMQALWKKHSDVSSPYTEADAEQILGELTANPDFARNFFDRFVRGNEPMDFAPLLANAGYGLLQANSARASLGKMQFALEKDGLKLVSYPLKGSPLYLGGLSKDDVILKINDKKASLETLKKELSKTSPNGNLNLVYRQRGVTREAKIATVRDPYLSVVKLKTSGQSDVDQTKTFRDNWLNSKSK